MPMKIKYITNDLETVIESDRLPEFNEERKKLKSVLEKNKYKDILAKDFSPILADIEGFGGFLDKGEFLDKRKIFYRDEDFIDVIIGSKSLGIAEEISSDLCLRCDFSPENKIEMKIKTFFRPDYPAFRIIEDGLLLSYYDGGDVELRRLKEDLGNIRLHMAPVTKAVEVVEEAKEIYKRMGGKKIEELQRLKNSCYEKVNDPHFGDIIVFSRKNEYIAALNKAMGSGTDYIFMDR